MDWKEYEQQVFEECERIYTGAIVKRNVRVRGIYSQRIRQIDVLVENAIIDGTKKSIFYDAKYYDKKVDIKEVESFISMLKDTGQDMGVIVTELGYSIAAIQRAHLGEKNIEVDILSLSELKQFQSIGAIPYCGNHGVVIQSPFGWIIDGKQNGFSLATIYPRGNTLESAIEHKEWMYLHIHEKDEKISNIVELIEYQNQRVLIMYPMAKFKVVNNNEIVIRIADIETYPTPEVTGFRDMGKFILYIVLFCAENVKQRDINKLCYSLESAIPASIKIK